MNFKLDRRAFLMGLGAVSLLAKYPALAAPGPTDVITAFYTALVNAMKSTEGFEGRYKIMESAIHAAFDIPTMTKISIGPAWTELPGVKKDMALRTFDHYIITSYAARFKRYNNHRFDVISAQSAGNGRMLVLSTLVRPGEEDIKFNYLLRLNNNSWQVIDIYLGGAISEMARLRSEYSEVLQREGIDGLLKEIEIKTGDLMKGA